jgi:hypothetical protein
VAPCPHIEVYLGDAPSPERSGLLCELSLLEVEYRRRAGEIPLPAEYQERFPRLEPAWRADAVEASSRCEEDPEGNGADPWATVDSHDIKADSPPQ